MEDLKMTENSKSSTRIGNIGKRMEDMSGELKMWLHQPSISLSYILNHCTVVHMGKRL
jgi:hypothetical protein